MNELLDPYQTNTQDWFYLNVQDVQRSRSQDQRSRSNIKLCEHSVLAINYERMIGLRSNLDYRIDINWTLKVT